MKQLLTLFFIGFITLTAYSQDDSFTGFAKGDTFISGTVGFSSSSQGEFSGNVFEFLPSVGYFLSDNIAGEITVIVGSTTLEQLNNKQTLTDLGIGLGATYFFTPANRFSFLIGGSLAYVNRKDKEDGFQDLTINSFAIGVSPGINYFVSDKFALRATLGAISYTNSKADFDGAEASNTFNLSLDLSDVNFGVIYKF